MVPKISTQVEVLYIKNQAQESFAQDNRKANLLFQQTSE